MLTETWEAWVHFATSGGGGGGCGSRVIIWEVGEGGLVQKKKSPDFRRPEVGISGIEIIQASCYSSPLARMAGARRGRGKSGKGRGKSGAQAEAK